jgi:hypothetical protein
MNEQSDAAVGDGSSGDKKKQIPLRLSYSLWVELAAWADAEFRSVNGQIEYLLNECVKKRKKDNMEHKE